MSTIYSLGIARAFRRQGLHQTQTSSRGKHYRYLQDQSIGKNTRLTLNSVNASEFPPFGLGEGIKSWRQRSPPLSIRRDVLVEFCSARIAWDIWANL